MADADNSLRQALLDTVAGLMNPDQVVRKAAEEQVKALEVTDEYGVYLCELTLNPQGLLPVRQLAAVLLKQYIDAHWSQDTEKFRPPEVTSSAKNSIRQMLPLGLSESISKVRNTVAFSLAAIAHWDWPDHWPQLFDILIQAIKGQDKFGVQGAVRVLKELSRDLTDSQIPTVAPVILPDIYRIFCEADRYTIRTRSSAVEIFTTLTNMICTIGEVNKGLQKSLLNPVLSTFSEALVASLSVPDSQTSDSGLKTEVLKALTVLIKNVPKQMSDWLPQILPPVWSTLTTSAEKYVREVVNGGGGDDEVVDSDGEVISFETLVFAIFEFVHALVETKKFRGAVKSGLADLMYYIVLYMQITG
ncbi:importin-9 [Eurytemora carolleeae]|uniref:importin-9 n=1 Tax=Eurytemora carolleeae TaxID=1294199 RepID=UPI000C75DFBE|nr:importin-9 [Eurytemora carolleeae]|eukprot:XP_023322142.1 importin-9-like [Eurytemora affinis]